MSTTHLSDDQIESYRREGYLVLPGFFGADEMADVDRAIREVTETAVASGDWSDVLELEPELQDGRQVPRRIYEPFDKHENFLRIGSEPRLLDCIEALIGPNIAHQYSKINMKPARVGSVVKWHQDMAYYPSTNDDLLAVLVYVDDATEENGVHPVNGEVPPVKGRPRKLPHYANRGKTSSSGGELASARSCFSTVRTALGKLRITGLLAQFDVARSFPQFPRPLLLQPTILTSERGTRFGIRKPPNHVPPPHLPDDPKMVVSRSCRGTIPTSSTTPGPTASLRAWLPRISAAVVSVNQCPWLPPPEAPSFSTPLRPTPHSPICRTNRVAR